MPVDGRALLDSLLTEKEFQVQVVEVARACGWHWYHSHDSRRSPAGFPDLVLVRGDRLIFAELKRESGRVTEAQRDWIDALSGGPWTACVWRPSDWETITAMLA